MKKSVNQIENKEMSNENIEENNQNGSSDHQNEVQKSEEGIEKDEFKLNNINLMFGKVNHVDYVTRMMKFPTLREILKNRNE